MYPDLDVVKQTLACNYYGTLKAIQTYLPHIRDGGRMVTVSSMAGRLHKFSPEIQQRFKSASKVEDVTKLMQDFEAAVAAGNEKEQGWISAAYATSKAGVTAMVRMISDQNKASGSKTLVNSCCPGWVKVMVPVCVQANCILTES